MFGPRPGCALSATPLKQTRLCHRPRRIVEGGSETQALGWEGETGAFVTTLPYTASSETQKIHPVVAYHYFNAGPVIGNFQAASIEVGLGKGLEFGYTHRFHAFGENIQLSPLWQNGFEIFNGKVNLLPENYKKMIWFPAISTGFIARTNVPGRRQLYGGGPLRQNDRKPNGDIYMVGSKTVQVKNAGPFAAFILSGGVRGTNAELWAWVTMLRIGKRERSGQLGLHLTDPAKARSFSSQRRHSNPTILTISMVAFRARPLGISRQRSRMMFGSFRLGKQS
jgi:hypothetical protein